MRGCSAGLGRLGLPGAATVAVAALVAFAGFHDQARAHEPGEARLPIDWSEASCLTIIDRSQGPIHPLSYGILGEDDPPTEDEPPDAHTHQFFSFCRDRDLLEALPNWISQADVDTAAEYNLVAAEVEPSELLADNPAWDGCWSRILADEDRRPITAEAASEPVPWDTSELAAGTYVVEGYTYEPPVNLWSPHPGVFKIVDDPDPAASGPAAALDYPEATKFVGANVDIRGCVDAMPGSTMTLTWAGYDTGFGPDGRVPIPTAESLEWQVLEADIPVENGSFTLAWQVPEAAAGTNVLVRLEVVDPMGRTWLANAQSVIGVISLTGGGGGGDDESGDTGDEDDAGLDLEGTGCSCSAGSQAPASPGPLAGLWGLFALVGFGRAHRRRASHTRA